ncbi:MAG: hypothetical protein ABIN58_02305 [candidate division WOR-3 bacterium]
MSDSFFPALERFAFFSRYAKTRGWFYVISWLHRLTGIYLFGLIIGYLYILSSSPNPNLFQTGFKTPVQPTLVLLAWASSLVLGFHALNGGRLILYELFGKRNDAEMTRWIFFLSAAYAAVFGLLLIMKDQHASPSFFGLMALLSGAIAAYAVARRIRKRAHSFFWKLQRISGGFLFMTAPAYLLFLSLNPGQPGTTHTAIAWIQEGFTRMAILILTVLALYHAGYGLFSITADYISSKRVLTGMTTIILVVIAVLFVLSFRIILFS